MREVSARTYRQRVLLELRAKAATARTHADSCVEEGENENAVPYENLDAYANGLEEALRLVARIPVEARKRQA